MILLDFLSAPALPAVGGLHLAHTARAEHQQHGIFLHTLQNRQHSFLYTVKCTHQRPKIFWTYILDIIFLLPS